MNKPIKVLHVLSDLGAGGIEKMLLNYYTHMNQSLVHFDFVTHRTIGMTGLIFERMGSKIFSFSLRRRHPFRSAIELFQLLKKENYDIIHLHGNIEISLQLVIAWILRVPIRIVHSHLAIIDNSLLTKFSRFFVKNITVHFATHKMACGIEAGRWQYGDKAVVGKDYYVIHNAIEIENFIFNSEIRNKVRRKLGVDKSWVVGHVGRFNYQKNHIFLVKIFEEILKLNSNSVLILVGTGEDEIKVQQQIVKLGLTDKVYLLGNRTDVAELLQAMDVFILPSLFEGFPVVLVEAQSAALPCVVSSECASDEVNITHTIKFLSLKEPIQFWAKAALESSKAFRSNTFDLMDKAGFNIISAAKTLESFYTGFLKV